MNMWADIKSNGFLNTSTSMLVEVDTKLDNQVCLQFLHVKLHIYHALVCPFAKKIFAYNILSSQKILHMKHLDIPASMTRKQINQLIR